MIQTRTDLTHLPVYEPGVADLPHGGDAVKLSSNEAALGPSPSAKAVYREQAAALLRYPDPVCSALRSALAEFNDLRFGPGGRRRRIGKPDSAPDPPVRGRGRRGGRQRACIRPVQDFGGERRRQARARARERLRCRSRRDDRRDNRQDENRLPGQSEQSHRDDAQRRRDTALCRSGAGHCSGGARFRLWRVRRPGASPAIPCPWCGRAGPTSW